MGLAELAQGDGSHGDDDDEHASTDWQRGSLFEHLFAPYGTTPRPRELPEGWLELLPEVDHQLGDDDDDDDAAEAGGLEEAEAAAEGERQWPTSQVRHACFTS
eukprot:COSAG01_NODE_21393_length_903_cov_0.878261_1_plen_102_part_10